MIQDSASIITRSLGFAFRFTCTSVADRHSHSLANLSRHCQLAKRVPPFPHLRYSNGYPRTETVAGVLAALEIYPQSNVKFTKEKHCSH